jgi:molybdate transport system substrate-binding protein
MHHNNHFSSVINFIDEAVMTRHIRQHTGILKMCLSATLGVWLTGSAVYAGTVTIAVTPGAMDAVDTIARAFEAAQAEERVRIVITPGTVLKGSIKDLPVQIVVSDDLSLIEWMEARKIASRPAARPAVFVPLAVVSGSTDSSGFGSTGDLINRMKQQGTVLAIPNPLKTECGRRAEALLKRVGVNVEPSERLVFTEQDGEVLTLVQKGYVRFGLVFAPDVIKTNGLPIHAVSLPGEFSPEYAFALKFGDQDHVGAQRFLAFLNTPHGQQALRARGYDLAQDPPAVQVSSLSISR